MTPPTLGLAVMVKDEEANLPRLLRSIAGAFDQVVLLDTGSTDRTIELFKSWAEKEDLPLGYRVGTFAWHHDHAAMRTAADALLATDWECWADADEVVIGARYLRPILARVPMDVPLLGAAWHGDPVEPERWVLRERVCRAGRGRWYHRAHPRKYAPEWGRILAWPVRWPVVKAQLDPRRVRFVHRGDPLRASSQERERLIMERWIHEEPENPLPLAQVQWLAALRIGSQ